VVVVASIIEMQFREFEIAGPLSPGPTEPREPTDPPAESPSISEENDVGCTRPINNSSTTVRQPLNVVFGRQGGAPIRWSAMDGTIHEVISVKAVSPICSIRDGNAFAGD
jgi:hypothetical protein